ncbi:MAG: hypothetical protein WBM17_10050 [Anaerolineales bacterium]
MRKRLALPKLLSASLMFGVLASSSLACTTITSLLASPTPTATQTPTITPTATPEPTPENLLSPAERSDYRVILRYVGEDVRTRFYPVMTFLLDQGYMVEMDSGPSNVGDMDIILFGSLSCNAALDDLEVILGGKLDITHLTRMRFGPDDASYSRKNIVIQIQSLSLFGPDL